MSEPDTPLPPDEIAAGPAPFASPEPRVGLPVSVGLHVGPALALVVFSVFFGQPKPFDAEAESIPVEMISESQLREMTRGEKTAKAVIPNAPERVDRVDPVKKENDPGQAKNDVAPPLPPKRQEEAAKEIKPELPPEVQPPKIDAPKPEPAKVASLTPPVPQPVARPVPQPPAAAPQKVEEDEPEDAEVVKQAAKTPPKPEPPKPDPAKVAEQKKQEDARKAEEQKKVEDAKKAEEQKKLEEKRVADLKKKAEEQKRAQLAAAKKAEEDRKKKEAELNQPTMDVDAIRRRLLASRETPSSTGSTGAALSRTVSLGTATGTGAKLSPSDRETLIGILQSQMQRCWNITVTSMPNVKPIVSVQLTQNGQIIGVPSITNSSSDPNFRAFAESGVRAIRQCASYNIPARFLPMYDDWKSVNVRLEQPDL